MRQRENPRRNAGNGRGTARRHYNRNRGGVSSVPIALPDGRVIGIVENGVFKKRIQGSRHILRRPSRSIALDLQTLRDAEKAGAKRVEITDTEDGSVYCASIGLIWDKGEEFNRHHGWQIRLPIGLWLRPGERVAEQPSLFGAAS